MRGLGTTQSYTCTMYTLEFEHEYQSLLVRLSNFRTTVRTSVRSFHPYLECCVSMSCSLELVKPVTLVAYFSTVYCLQCEEDGRDYEGFQYEVEITTTCLWCYETGRNRGRRVSQISTAAAITATVKPLLSVLQYTVVLKYADALGNRLLKLHNAQSVLQ